MTDKEKKKPITKVQVNLDPLLGEVLGMVSMHVRGHVARNALMQYMRSEEGRQFFKGFGVDLDLELAARGLDEGDISAVAVSTVAQPIKVHAKELEIRKPRHSGFERD
jgi:hypothetical protein